MPRRFRITAYGLAANGFGEHSPGGYGLRSALIMEVVLSAGFLLVILGSTDARAPNGFAPIAIGLALALIHLISIPVTNTSVNPARSTGPAIFVGGWALGQLWLFWLAPIVGALIAGFGYRAFADEVTPIVVRRTEAGLVWIPKTITLVKFVIFPSKTHGRADPAATEDLSRLWLAWLDRYLR